MRELLQRPAKEIEVQRYSHAHDAHVTFLEAAVNVCAVVSVGS